MLNERDLSEILLWDEGRIEDALSDDANEEQLTALLGREGFEEARTLAAKERRKFRGAKPRAYILPGVVGSKLGNEKRILEKLELLIWLNPLRIRKKGLDDLALDSGKEIRTFGVFQTTYFLLHLHLRKEGYAVRNFAYDWRLPLKDSAEALAKALREDGDRDIHIIAHSMGGLLIREVLGKDAKRFKNIERIITLGTPHAGSFAPAPVLEGTHRYLKMAANISGDEPARLVEEVFATMPGFYELLPSPDAFDNDLCDRASWPRNGPDVDANLLDQSAQAHRDRPDVDHRFRAIIGYGRETICNAIAGDSAFAYEASHDGDGAVLLKSAEIEGVPAWYSTAEHGNLPNASQVRRAVVDLLENDRTDVLIRTPQRRNDSFPYQLRSPDRRLKPNEEVDHATLRQLFSDFAAPYRADDDIASDSKPSGAPIPPKNDIPIITTYGPGSETRHFEIKLFGGSLLDAPVRVVAAGVIDGVAPGGAASSLDEALGGKFSKLRDANGIDARQGGLTIATATRSPIRADMAYLLGLGDLSIIHEDGICAAVRALCRRLIIDRLDDCAIVLFGANSGMSIEECMRAIMRGVTTALEEWDVEALLRNITICENDPKKFDEISAATDTALRALDLKRTIQIRKVTSRQFQAATPTRKTTTETLPKQWNLVHLNVDVFESQNSKKFTYTMLAGACSASTAGGEVEVSQPDFEKLLSDISGDGSIESIQRAKKLGMDMRQLLLPPPILNALESNLGEKRLVIVHKKEGSRVPWELLMLNDGKFPALGGGISRVYSSSFVQAPTKWKGSSNNKKLRVLIISNPTKDLKGAEIETEALKRLLSGRKNVEFVSLERDDATKSRILELMGSGSTLDEPGFDIVHYAGHADHDELEPGNGGLLAAGDEFITGRDIQDLPVIPPIVFFNACQSGKIRLTRSGGKLIPKRTIDRSVSLAEAFLEGGVRSFVGTYWPVGDTSAKLFSNTFYSALISGATLGTALVQSRRAVFESKNADWADYMHFGDFDFSL